MGIKGSVIGGEAITQRPKTCLLDQNKYD
ncbi:uncharacterized protein G2W53_035409 [Senna tora]|uniref:Uncharacterized protein n=1 Tax=Senna tora TaxID=362788 RepID=A0A834SST1_9FABA|nr:uncharacterized protein G2W53_035409 [Senna tora]